MKCKSLINKTLLSNVLFILLISCNSESTNDCRNKPNPYKLPLIQCISDYQALVLKNPNMELVDLEEYIPNIKLDIRYASENNFTGKIIYSMAKAYARKPVAISLKQLQDSLNKLGLGLKIYDAYRPYSATLKFCEVYPDTNFVANPKYGSRHNRGCAIDLSLINLLTGNEIPLPTSFDDFSEKAHPEYPYLPEEVLKNRSFLFDILSHFGFTHYPTEWWHFDYQGWNNYPLMDLSFEELNKK